METSLLELVKMKLVCGSISKEGDYSSISVQNYLYLYHMFVKLLQNPDLPFAEQKDVLKAVIHDKLKANIPEVRLQLTHNYEPLKPILLRHWRYSFRIALALFNWQLAKDFMNGVKQGNVAIDLILSLSREGEDAKARGQYLLVQLSKSYKEHWKCLVILEIAASIFSERITNVEDYNWFLANFVRVSAGVIQNYLEVRSDAKSSDDRPESDQILVENCEKWVTSAYLRLFSQLKIPNSQPLKRSILSALSQIVGALYESERQGHLNAQRLHEIMKQAGKYVLRSYSIDEISQLFLVRLRQLKYNNPPKKIQIPDFYTDKSEINTEGVCWIINHFLSEGRHIYSLRKQLDLLILAYSELLPFPLKLKHALLSNIKSLINEGTAFSAEFELTYPLGLLCFHVYHYDKAEFESLAENLEFGKNQITKINRLRRLLQISIDNLNVEKLSFVLEQLDESSLSQKEVLLLIKTVSLDFINVELGKKLLQVISRVIQLQGSNAKKIINILAQRERNAKHNIQLCDQIAAESK